ncbi:hypothetical protein [Paraburkholderia solisilvae]|uniref:hypothetical protein n=1 Tax=Paraburkholderia solisilvae TaxID=624376 RepID=UPI001582808D|nr:hypothetical protein [Paraburkholderia solisilvae]
MSSRFDITRQARRSLRLLASPAGRWLKPYRMDRVRNVKPALQLFYPLSKSHNVSALRIPIAFMIENPYSISKERLQ